MEQLDLGGAADAPPPPEDTLTVGDLNRTIAESLVAAFPREVWVRGEIQQLRRSQIGHAYFELVEKDGNRDNVRARVSVALFKTDRVAVNATLKAVPGVKISDGVEVRIRGRVEYYPPSGRLQVVMTGIDPVFTVGKLAADRDRVLQALSAEGILRANAAHDLPLVPLQVGLVSSGGTAGYRDFVHGLETSGFAFRVVHRDVRVQGAGAWRRIKYALDQLAERTDVDVVVLVRGGGARSDLAPFDAEAVARAITRMPCPVLTGIGHEIDRTVADEVAHTACKTPTAVATLLVDQVEDYVDRLGRVSHRVTTRARAVCTAASRDVADAARRVHRGAPVALTRERTALAGLRTRAVDAGRRGTRDAGRRMEAAEARLRALDPRRVLERGYSITRDGAGRVVRTADAVASGDDLLTETAAGAIRSRVIDEDGAG